MPIAAQYNDIVEEINLGIELGQDLRQRAMYTDAIKCFDRSLQLAVDMYQTKYHPFIVKILYHAGRVYHITGDIACAQMIFQEVLDISRQVQECDIIVADVLFRLGHIEQSIGHCRVAFEYYVSALRVVLPVHGTRYNTDVATILFNMGMISREMGDLNTAQALYEECVHIERYVAGCANNFVSEGLKLIDEIRSERRNHRGSWDDDEEFDDTQLLANARRLLLLHLTQFYSADHGMGRQISQYPTDGSHSLTSDMANDDNFCAPAA